MTREVQEEDEKHEGYGGQEEHNKYMTIHLTIIMHPPWVRCVLGPRGAAPAHPPQLKDCKRPRREQLWRIHYRKEIGRVPRWEGRGGVRRCVYNGEDLGRCWRRGASSGASAMGRSLGACICANAIAGECLAAEMVPRTCVTAGVEVGGGKAARTS